MGQMELRWGSPDGMAIRDRGIALHFRQCSVLAAGVALPFSLFVLAYRMPIGACNPMLCNPMFTSSRQFTTYLGDLFGTMDWSHFYQVAGSFGGWGGECPSFFPLPRLTPGANPAKPNSASANYTHIYKHSYGTTTSTSF